MEFFLIDVDTINCPVPYSDIKENEPILERLAHIILDSEGIINPVFVKKIGFDSYELVYGHLEYYAAVKASKIDPKKGEMIAAFVIENSEKEAIQTQINLLRKSLSGENQETLVCTAGDNYNKLNSVHRDIHKIHEKIDSLMEMNTAKGIRQLLRKQLDMIIFEAESKDKKEAIQFLQKAQYELQEHQNKIKEEILELSKVNLADATYNELSSLMKEVGIKESQINASWKAIEYWRQPDKELSWDNLKKSTINKSTDKITGFAQGTYNNLRKVAYL